MKNEHSFASKINIDQFAKRKPPERIESDGYMFDVAFSSLLRWPLKGKAHSTVPSGILTEAPPITNIYATFHTLLIYGCKIIK